jgi:hypothetical protein
MISMKTGDTVPAISITVDDAGAIVDLTPATSVHIVGAHNGQPTFNIVATGNNVGVVTAPWPTGSTDTPGMTVCEAVAIWPGGGRQTFPGSGRLYVNIEPAIV